MSRRRAILAGVGGVVLIALMLQVALRHGTPTFQAGGAGLSAAPAAGNVASRPAAPAAPAARPGGAAAADSARGASAPAAIEGQAAPAQALPSLDRMIVRNVSMTLVVANVVEAYHQIEQIALEQGGLVAGSQVRQEGDRTLATVTLRVPADGRAYQATLDRLRELADRVLDEQGQTQDVSEEYVDLESRLRNLRATEASLLALYEKTQRLEDVFAVQREVTAIRGQIEQAEGRKQALERRAAMATLTLQLREPAGLSPRQREWSPQDVAADALAALAWALRGVGTVAIWLVVWLPLYGVPLVALWLLRGRLRALRDPGGARST
ncbi:MAG TPA: DUF4349 domain-containing protein [Chloroflexota bacterium]|nr:DUF4349 domain-containing protein [Chloroflexota bacterium]